MTLERAVSHLAARAEVILDREPLIDPSCPSTSDLDLLAFGQVDDLCLQRLHFPEAKAGLLMIDLVWLPTKTLYDPESFAVPPMVWSLIGC